MMRRAHYSSVDASRRQAAATRSVRVLYDFHYVSAEGKSVNIKRGEKLTLLDKTDGEWWKVSRFKTPFYVPANYVEEVPSTAATGPSIAGLAAATALEESTLKYMDVAQWAGGGLLGLKWRLGASAAWPEPSAVGSRANELHRDSSHEDDDDDETSGDGVRQTKVEERGGRLESGSGGLPRKALLRSVAGSERQSPKPTALRTRGRYSIAADSRSCSSEDNFDDDNNGDKSAHERPMRNGSDAAKVAAVIHSGLNRGRVGLNRSEATRQRPYVFNGDDRTDGNDGAVPKRLPAALDIPTVGLRLDEAVPAVTVNGRSSPAAAMSTSGDVALGYHQPQEHEKLVKKSSINRSTPKGWTETVDGRGQKTFIHTATGDRWLSAEDSNSGRTYYYKENTNRTVWELPDHAACETTESLASRPAPKPLHLGRPPATRSISMPEHKAEQGESEDKESAMEKGRLPKTRIPAAAALVQASGHHMTLLAAVVAARRGSDADGPAGSAGATATGATKASHPRPHSAPEGVLGSDASLAEIDDNEASVGEDGSGVTTPSSSEASPSWTNLIGDSNSPAVGRLRQLQTSDAIIKDIMQTCRVSDGGRKSIKKRWEPSAVVMKAAQLFIYKEDKSPTKQVADDAAPEAVLNLQSAKVSWSSLRGSKKGALEVACDNGCYLLQHDDPMILREWHSLLSESRSLSGNQPPLPLQESKERGSSNKDLTGLDTTDDLAGDEPAIDGSWRTKSNVFKRGGYNLNPSANLVGVREKLKGLLARRPAIKDLEAKGIIRENIFSTHLLFLCNREQTTVPKFVERCIAAIEAKGLDVEGLYRVAPSAADVQGLRNQIDSDSCYTLSQCDVHILASTLKMFFRELQEPLIPFDYYKMFIDALNIPDPVNRLSTFKLLISMMMPASRDTLHTLMAHLLRVSEHCEKNKMTLENIATIFGQTLMRPEDDAMGASLSSALVHNRVIMYLLVNYDKIF